MKWLEVCSAVSHSRYFTSVHHFSIPHPPRVLQNVRFARNGHVSFNEFITFDGGSACDGPAARAHPSNSPHATNTTPRTPSSAALWPGAPTGRRGGSAADAAHGPQQQQPAPGSLSDITPEKYGPPRCARDDVITTLNLPLLGVLRTVDKVSRFKAFVEIAIKQFFSQEKESGKFDGLFMQRCVPPRHPGPSQPPNPHH